MSPLEKNVNRLIQVKKRNQGLEKFWYVCMIAENEY